MRTTILMFAITIFAITAEAQEPGLLNLAPTALFGHNNFLPDSAANKKWSISTYSGITTGFYSLNGISSTYIAAPIGLQLNYMLNKNLYAFAGVSAAPAYVNFNQSFLSSDANKIYPNSFYNANNLGLYSRAELGLMYVNDARTFSISGSFGVQRGGYPLLPYQSANSTKRNPVLSTNR